MIIFRISNTIIEGYVMNKYILDEKIELTYNASSKARDDVGVFVESYTDEQGKKYLPLGINDKRNTHTKIEKAFVGVKSLASIFVKIKSGDILFVQSSFKILKVINVMKHIKKFKTIYLIHDLDSLRDAYDDDRRNSDTIRILNKQDVIICHNNKMIEELQRRKCTTKMVNMEIFDYYLDENRPVGLRKLEQVRLCFAGNLNPEKTGFLYLLDKKPPISYNVEVFGKKAIDFSNLHYCGCYTPEELPYKMDGEFGLIWEGNEYIYDENSHPYIMFNNPHKASLYIVSRLPIIIWRKAALAELIQREGIGIVVDSIQDIENVLGKITPKEYQNMQNKLEGFRRRILTGEHLHSAIREAENLLQN